MIVHFDKSWQRQPLTPDVLILLSIEGTLHNFAYSPDLSAEYAFRDDSKKTFCRKLHAFKKAKREIPILLLRISPE